MRHTTEGLHSKRVAAVVVAYQPDVGVLGELLSTIGRQVECIHLVDNTPALDCRVELLLSDLGLTNITLLRLGENLGIAKALNVGIASARASCVTHVLLSDQDSLPEAAMVANLVQTLSELAMQGARVGAVSPAFKDRNTGIDLPFQALVSGNFFYGHLRPDAACPVVEALTLITSGMLVPIEVLDDVGPMREDFFIDHVDIEWCHRARSRGWKLFGTSNASMLHSMGGEQSLRVWYFGWRQESAYSPLRMYYRIRNFVVLCGLDYIDVRWKIRNGWYWLGFVYSHVVFGHTKFASLRMAWMGLVDGLRGRLGPHSAIR